MGILETKAAQLEALGNPVRLAIYRFLVRFGDEGRPVGAIQQEVDIPASTLSHHLKHMEMMGLIERRKQGTTHICIARIDTMNALIDYLSKECCVDAGAC